MHIRLATIDDLALLVQLRVEISHELDNPGDEALATLAAALEGYFTQALPGEDFAALLAFEGEEAAACAFLAISQKPPSLNDLTGRRGYITNVYTRRRWRGKGHASRLMQELVALAHSRGVRRLELTATPAGRPVYELVGFCPHKGVFMTLVANEGETPCKK